MIAASMVAVTALVAGLIAWRHFSPAFRARAESPKYKFQESLDSARRTGENRDDAD